MRLIPLCLLVLVMVPTLSPTAETPSSPLVDLDFCQLPVSDVHRQGRASFSVVYAFNLMDERPVDIREISNPAGIPADAVSVCLRKWRLGGLSNVGAEMVAEFRWTHGIGWEYLKVKGAGLDQKVSITGDRCGYR